ncbi:hypothetical protein [Ectobacillus ponti]|uniref:Uncharacterized protein n=1 Tax=Ectobacillus ponti TaxID=2961894 RepID=A0AA42BRQ0_9BACI|nr:hypothetical protein [Ectobacillus ponti]MCP8969729.1 hypothetical protein [Ectobacillus ponti]
MSIATSAAYKAGIYANVRQIDAQIDFTFQGTKTTYGDERIVKINIVEEISVLNDTIPSDQLTIVLDNTDGTFNFLNLQNMQQIIASRPQIDVRFGLKLDTSTEWLQMGTYYVDAWKNDPGAMTITLTAHDNMMMLDNINYSGSGKGMTLYNIAADIFAVAGITKYYIDPALKNTTTSTGFKDRLSCRNALQHVGIMGQAAVYQDRDGTVMVKRFATLDASLLYLNYASTQRTLWGYPGASNTILNNTDGGMRYIDLNDMYAIPEITLDKSVYQVVVKVYSVDGSSADSVFTNTSIAGQNGQSFTIDNPLISDAATAAKVANWFIAESNYNAVYKSTWRQNPCLQATDVVIVESGFKSGQNNVIKQTRVYKQEFNYEGYLSGVTESRGGI